MCLKHAYPLASQSPLLVDTYAVEGCPHTEHAGFTEDCTGTSAKVNQRQILCQIPVTGYLP